MLSGVAYSVLRQMWMHWFVNVHFYWYFINKISTWIHWELYSCFISSSLRTETSISGLSFGTRVPRQPGSILWGGRFEVLWCSSGSFYIATFGPQRDWRVIFRQSAWGIMLSAQPITDLHTHPTLNSLGWLRLGWGVSNMPPQLM